MDNHSVASSPSAPRVYGKRFATEVVFRFLETYSRATEILAFSVGISPARIHKQLIYELQHNQLKWRSWKILIKWVHNDDGLGTLLLRPDATWAIRVAYLKRLRYMADDAAMDELEAL